MNLDKYLNKVVRRNSNGDKLKVIEIFGILSLIDAESEDESLAILTDFDDLEANFTLI